MIPDDIQRLIDDVTLIGLTESEAAFVRMEIESRYADAMKTRMDALRIISGPCDVSTCLNFIREHGKPDYQFPQDDKNAPMTLLIEVARTMIGSET